MGRPKKLPASNAKLADTELVEHYRACDALSEEVMPAILKYANEGFESYAGKFLTQKDKDFFERTDRIPVEVNLVCIKTNTALGLQQSNRQETQFRPDNDDSNVNVSADWMTRLVRKVINKCEGHRHQTNVLLDGLCSGYGFATVYLDNSRRPPRIMLKEVPLGQMRIDPDSIEDGFEDARFWIRCAPWPVEDVIATWPAKEEEIKMAAASNRSGSLKKAMAIVSKNILRETVEVVQFEYKRPLPRVRWYDPIRDEWMDTTPEEQAERDKVLAKEVDPITGDRMFAKIEGENYRGETFFRGYLLPVAKRGSDVVLDHVEISGFSFPSYTGLQIKKVSREKNRVRRFGPVAMLTHLQKIFNRMLLEHLSYLARANKGGGRFTKEALPEGVTPEEFVDKQSAPAPWILVNEIGQIEDAPVAQSPTGLVEGERLIMQYMGQASGWTDALAGTMTQERANVLVSNLQNQNMIAMGPIMDPFTLFVKNCGLTIIRMMLAHMEASDLTKMLGNPQVEGLTYELDEQGQKVPIMGPDGETPIGAGDILKGEDPLDFDVSVDVGKAQTWTQAAIWEMFQQGVLQTMQNAGVPMEEVVPMLLANLPLPGVAAKELADRVAHAMEEAKKLQTEEGVREFLLSLGPDAAMPLLQAVVQEFQASLPPGEELLPPEEGEAEEDQGEGMGIEPPVEPEQPAAAQPF